MADGDITKLPRWAQRKIEVLEANVRWWQEKATAGPDGSDTFAMNVGDENTPLGCERRVKFQMGERWDECIEVHTFRQDAGKDLVVRTSHSPIMVIPSASNSFIVRLEGC